MSPCRYGARAAMSGVAAVNVASGCCARKVATAHSSMNIIQAS